MIATLCFLIKDNQILLAMKKRGMGVGKWNGVGGKQIPGESIEDAAKREAQEEIGVKLNNLEAVGIVNFLSTEFPHDTINDIQVYVYLSKDWSGKPSESEEMAPKWFKINNIPYDRMWEDDKIWLPLVLNNKKITAKFVFDKNNQLIEHQIKVVDNISKL